MKSVICVEQSKPELLKSPNPVVFIVAISTEQHWHFQCSSSSDRDEWMEVLRAQCKSNPNQKMSSKFCPGVLKGGSWNCHNTRKWGCTPCTTE